MNWLEKVSKSFAEIKSYSGGLLKVQIKDKVYIYYASPPSYKKLNRFIQVGNNSEVRNILHSLDLAEKSTICDWCQDEIPENELEYYNGWPHCPSCKGS